MTLRLSHALCLTAIASLLSACAAGSSSQIPVMQPGPHAQAVTQNASPVIVRDHGLTLHLFLPRGQAAATSAASTSNNLIYGGGPIMPAPKIYLVLWGDWSATLGDPNGEAPVLEKFLAAVGGSSWLNSVTQYTQSDGTHIGNAAGSYGGVWNDPSLLSPAPTSLDLANEAVAAAAHFGDYSVNASYVIATPHLHNSPGFMAQYCAWHSTTTANGSTIAFTNLPYLPDAGTLCGQGSVNSPGTLDGVTIVEGHEQGETETDPQLNAWLDASGNENGDKCAWTGLQNTAFGSQTFPTQPLWSNATASCVQSYP